MSDLPFNNKVDGVDRFSADEWNQLVNRANDSVNWTDEVGTSPGQVPVIGGDGKLDPSILPASGGGGGGSGTVVGPGSSTSGNAAVFTGADGSTIGDAGAAPILEGDARLTPGVSDVTGLQDALDAKLAITDLTTEFTTAATDGTSGPNIGAAALDAILLRDPGDNQDDFNALSLTWGGAAFTTGGFLYANDGATTEVRSLTGTSMNPSVSGLIAGTADMVVDAETVQSVMRYRAATLASGDLTFDASTGLNWYIEEGADNITVKESCWTNIPIDKEGRLTLVADSDARTVTPENTSTNLDTSDGTDGFAPYNSVNCKKEFALGWYPQDSDNLDTKGRRYFKFLGYTAA